MFYKLWYVQILQILVRYDTLNLLPYGFSTIYDVGIKYARFTLYDLLDCTYEDGTPLLEGKPAHAYLVEQAQIEFTGVALPIVTVTRSFGKGATRPLQTVSLSRLQVIRFVSRFQGTSGSRMRSAIEEYIDALENSWIAAEKALHLSYQREAEMLEQRTRQAEQDALHLDNVYNEIKRGFDDIRQAYESCLKHVPLREQGLKTLRKRLAALAVRYQGIPVISQASSHVQTPDALRLKVAANEQSYIARLEHDTAEERRGKEAVDIGGITVHI